MGNMKKITDKITFKKHKDTLNNVQKALENYLELKRVAFPRFQFLSNDEYESHLKTMPLSGFGLFPDLYYQVKEIRIFL